MRFVLLGTLAACLFGCGSFVILPKFEVAGEYKLSGDDLRQIAQLPERGGIHRQIEQVTSNKADEATVSCGIPYLQKSELTVFTARRKGRSLGHRQTVDTHGDSDTHRLT
jgi:hypothetical protein